jgi:mono/diheme cytochrome c family protein
VKYLASAVAFSIGLLAWCQGGSLVQRASSKAHPLSNPLENNPEAQLAGAKLYQRECAGCHGESREGSARIPPLAQPEVYRAAPGTLFWILRNGSLTTGMPSFAHLPEVQRWQIIAFLIRVTPTSTTGAAGESPAKPSRELLRDFLTYDSSAKTLSSNARSSSSRGEYGPGE